MYDFSIDRSIMIFENIRPPHGQPWACEILGECLGGGGGGVIETTDLFLFIETSLRMFAGRQIQSYFHTSYFFLPACAAEE